QRSFPPAGGWPANTLPWQRRGEETRSWLISVSASQQGFCLRKWLSSRKSFSQVSLTSSGHPAFDAGEGGRLASGMSSRVTDLHIARNLPLPAPTSLLTEISRSDAQADFVAEARKTIASILFG